MPAPIKSKSSLAAALGISVSRLTQLEREAPLPDRIDGAFDMAACRAWRKSLVAKKPKDTDTLTAAKLERIKAQTELDRVRLSNLQGKLLKFEDVEQRDAKVAAGARSVLYSILVNELPPALEGRPIVEVRRRLTEAADKICAKISEGFAHWLEERRPEQKTDEPTDDDNEGE